MVDVLVSEIGLNGASVVAIVGELVAASVPEHVRVRGKGQPSEPAGARDHLVHVEACHRTAASVQEDERRWRAFSAKPLQRVGFNARDRMGRRAPILQPRHVQYAFLEIHLIPAQPSELARTQTMPVCDENERCIAVSIEPISLHGPNHRVDFARGEVLAGADFAIAFSLRRRSSHDDEVRCATQPEMPRVESGGKCPKS